MSRAVNDLEFGTRNLLCQRRVRRWCRAAIISFAYYDSGAADLVEIWKWLLDREQGAHLP